MRMHILNNACKKYTSTKQNEMHLTKKKELISTCDKKY